MSDASVNRCLLYDTGFVAFQDNKSGDNVPLRRCSEDQYQSTTVTMWIAEHHNGSWQQLL